MAKSDLWIARYASVHRPDWKDTQCNFGLTGQKNWKKVWTPSASLA
jgi:hypothetical protein